jgi:N-acetylmuramoyl-L-alanine amidase
LGILGSLLLSSSAEAATLQFWRFNTNDNRLIFTTDEGVQPRAQLLSNPTRLVIDLPDTTLGRSLVNQVVGGAIREVRVAQFDAQTTRLVIELNPGYTLNPRDILVRGTTPTQWVVQLPTPERESGSYPPAATTPPSTRPSSTPVAGGSTQIEGVRVTPDGFFIRTTGGSPELEVERSRDRRQVNIDLANTTLSPRLEQRDVQVNGNGVNRIQFTQAETNPPTARITLDLANEEIDWQASVSGLGGIVIIPVGSIAETPRSSDPRHNDDDSPQVRPEQPQIATIQGIELSGDGSQLVIRADQPVTFTSGWDRATTFYRITVPSARLAPRVTGPRLPQGSSLLSVRLRQEDNNTVSILVQPAAGVRIGDVNQPSSQLLALSLERNRPVQPPPIGRPNTPPSSAGPLPSVRNGRIVVVIDPGHGGSDPGAIGIGGLRETNIVLPIGLRVAELLQQQGVQAILTRRDERDVELDPRVQIAERANADLFVSIHANSINLSRPDVNGIETYYYSPEGARLAQVVHSNVIRGTGMIDRGVRRARFYVIRNTTMPSILVETGFVTGAQDARLLSDPNFRDQMAMAIARGILQYIQQNF